MYMHTIVYIIYSINNGHWNVFYSTLKIIMHTIKDILILNSTKKENINIITFFKPKQDLQNDILKMTPLHGQK